MRLFSSSGFNGLKQAVAVSALLALSTYCVAQQQIEFFDDFSSDSISYIVDDRPNENEVKSFTIKPSGFDLRVRATGEQQGQAQIWISDRTDIVRTRVSLSSETDIPADDESDVRLRISGIWYNEIQDNGLGNGDRTGDVYGQARLRLRGPERREFSVCLDRELADGSNEGVDIFNGDNCVVMPDFELELDTVYELRMELDREAGTIAFAIDDQEIVTSIGQPVYKAAYSGKQIQLIHEGTSGEAFASVLALGTDGDLQVFSEEPLVSSPYRPLFSLERDGSDISIVNQRARFEANGPVDSVQSTSLTVFGTSNSIEGIIELSSDSVVFDNRSEGDNSFARMRIGGTFYNDTAEGGFNDNEGNVFAQIALVQNQDNLLELEYCLFRSNTADFSSATELVMQDGTECGDFGIVPELDTQYASSIATDLDAGTVTFSVNGIQRTHIITTAAFAPDAARQFLSAQARATAGSTAIGYLDDFRTSANAPLLTPSSVDGDSTSNSSGGCSVAGKGGFGDPLLAILGLLAFVGLCSKRRILSS